MTFAEQSLDTPYAREVPGQRTDEARRDVAAR